MSTTCRHIKTNGVRCGSPALTGKPRCYYHHRLHQQDQASERARSFARELVLHPLNPGPDGAQREPLTAEYFRPQPAELDFPVIEDRDAIQLSLSMVIRALGRNEIDLKRAGMMLYALQVASSNVRQQTPPPENIIRETVTDDDGLELTPDIDPEIPETPDDQLDTVSLLMRKWAAEDQSNLDLASNPQQNLDLAPSRTQNQDFTATEGEGVPTAHLHS